MPVSVNFDSLSERMRRLRVPQETVARLVGFPPTQISRAANHQVDLTYPEWRRVEALIADLEEICHRAGLLVDWKNHEALKAKISELETERRDPPEFPTEQDYKLLRAVSAGIAFPAVAEEMGCNVDQLFNLLDTANKRFAYQTVQMSKWTEARKAHQGLIEQEMVDRKRMQQQ